LALLSALPVIMLIIIKSCYNNLNWKCWAVFSSKLSEPPGDPDYPDPYYRQPSVLNKKLRTAVRSGGGGGGQHFAQGLRLRKRFFARRKQRNAALTTEADIMSSYEVSRTRQRKAIARETETYRDRVLTLLKPSGYFTYLPA
jgi:hypothetical protein